VCVRFRQGFSDYLAIVECKDEKVSIDQVESLSKKQEDVGAARVILVSSKGFQKGAIAAAESYGIDTHVLTEERADWTRSVRKHVHELPFPRGIEFDMPPVPESMRGPGRFAKYADIDFVDSNRGAPFTLATIARDVSLWAHKSKLPLPCVVELNFEDGTAFKPPGQQTFIPVNGLKIELA
jgi:hypothetical protein